MTKRFIFLLVLGVGMLACEPDHLETISVQIKGKPINLVYTPKLSSGFIDWYYDGEIQGKVGVCTSGCEGIVEEGYVANCPQGDTLSGKFSHQRQRGGVIDAEQPRQNYCLIFIPEEGSYGEVRVTFDERHCCNGGW